MSGLVVVGVDGSASSLAVVEAAAGGRVVHAFIWPTMHLPLGPSTPGRPEGGLRNVVEQLVAEAVARARTVTPEVDVTHAVVNGG